MSAPSSQPSPSKHLKSLHRKHGGSQSLKAFAAQLRHKDAESLALVTTWLSNSAPKKRNHAGGLVTTKKAPEHVPSAKGTVLKKR